MQPKVMLSSVRRGLAVCVTRSPRYSRFSTTNAVRFEQASQRPVPRARCACRWSRVRGRRSSWNSRPPVVNRCTTDAVAGIATVGRLRGWSCFLAEAQEAQTVGLTRLKGMWHAVGALPPLNPPWAWELLCERRFATGERPQSPILRAASGITPDNSNDEDRQGNQCVACDRRVRQVGRGISGG